MKHPRSVEFPQEAAHLEKRRWLILLPSYTRWTGDPPRVPGSIAGLVVESDDPRHLPKPNDEVLFDAYDGTRFHAYVVNVVNEVIVRGLNERTVRHVTVRLRDARPGFNKPVELAADGGGSEGDPDPREDAGPRRLPPRPLDPSED